MTAEIRITPDFYIRHLSEEFGTLVRLFDGEGKKRLEAAPDPKPDDGALARSDILNQILAVAEAYREVPAVFTVNRVFFCMALRIGGHTILMGPLVSSVPFSCENDLNVPMKREEQQRLLEALTPVPFERAMEGLIVLSNLAREEGTDGETGWVTLERCIRQNRIENRHADQVLGDVTNTIFENMERGFVHNPYDEEVREFAAVERGDTELLSRILEEDYVGKVGILADDVLRHMKNLSIVIITLASRAAIRGGVPYEVAFSMSDRFIRELEEIGSPTEAESFGRAAELQYAKLVRDYQEAVRNVHSGQENEHVEKCKDYIFRHLHGKIRVSELAEKLALNTNYLSTLFRRCEGITITEYILRQKLQLVRNLLIYSDYTYLEITNYLGFPSQSHLGKKFKEETGMTLRQYRTKYRVRGFSGG